MPTSIPRRRAAGKGGHAAGSGEAAEWYNSLMANLRFQFRLRSIFILIAVVGLACVMVPFAVKQYSEKARRERIRLQRLETLDKFDGPNVRHVR
jgi:hypothetical protein